MMFFKSIRVQIIMCLLVLAALTGCETGRYYTQAVSGQISILKRRKPIQEYLADPRTPSSLKTKLALILKLRDFAQNELRLPVKKQFLDFVELDRPYVLWNVYAAPEFSMDPKTWCYPVAGCTAYRGYFEKKAAVHFADQLKREGLDVYVSGIRAYSTLGWFNDPVYSSFIHLSEVRLAALIIHELAHQIVYVTDDNTFNESFATAVEQEGLRRWLASRNQPEAFGVYQDDYRRRKEFIELVQTCRRWLSELYAKDISKARKRRLKASTFKQLVDQYRLLKKRWGGYSGYDAWFDRKLNNAQLITVSIYNDLVPGFLNLLAQTGNDLPAFYEKSRQIGKMPANDRRAILMSKSK